LAQNVMIAGATYTDVPAVDIPKSGGGTARFYDVSGNVVLASNGNYDVTEWARATVAIPTYDGTVE